MSDIKRYVYIEMTDEQYQEQSAVLWNLKKVGQRICNADIEKAYQDKIDSLITTIESQKEEIESQKSLITEGIKIETIYREERDEARSYLDVAKYQIESLKAITELKNEMLQDAENRILAAIESRDKYQGITELAVNGLKRVMTGGFEFPQTRNSFIEDTLSEIERLQND